MEPRSRDLQMVSVIAAFVFMGCMAGAPMVFLGHRGSWTVEALLLPLGLGATGAFALAVLLRSQRLGPDESIFDGTFGLVVASIGIALCGAGEGVFVWAFATGHIDDLPVEGRERTAAPVALALGLAYLARRVHANLAARAETRPQRTGPARRRARPKKRATANADPER